MQIFEEITFLEPAKSDKITLPSFFFWKYEIFFKIMHLLNSCTSCYLFLYYRKQTKKTELLPEEIPPEKLSQEAFRLLRTAQSILNTREPDLAHMNKINEPEDDLNFISQLAKEFPQENKSKATSISLSPKLLVPEKEIPILPRVSRKLSLHSNGSSTQSTIGDQSNRNNFGNIESLSNNKQYSLGVDTRRQSTYKSDSEKSISPTISSIGSTEDESGFSSMTSFQEVGLPISTSLLSEETLTKDALLRSMLHDDSSEDFYSLQDYKFSDNYILDNSKYNTTVDSQKLWTKIANVSHKRSSSTPVDNAAKEKISMKVLWV